jgi:hypothetical protein
MSSRPSNRGGSTPGADGMHEALWSMSQRSRSLQDLRKDIRNVWNDEAASDVNGRYLDPHEFEDDRMSTALGEQRELLEHAAQTLESTTDLTLLIDECSAFVTEKLQFAEQDMDNSYSDFDQYVHYNSEARSKFPLVLELIDHANAAC